MGTPSLQVTSVTITVPDPRELARFHSRLLDRPVTSEEGPGPGEPDTAGWAQIRPPGEPPGYAEPTLNFEYEQHWTAPTWPAQAGRPHATQHLDIYVDDLGAAVAHAVAAGATEAPEQPQGGQGGPDQGVRVLFDPAGHPFCLFS